MENENFDIKKVIENMEALKNKRLDEMKRDLIEKNGTDEKVSEESINVKYLGSMEFINEQGELIDKDVFVLIEEHDGQFQIRYYDEDQKLLGIQRTFDEEIIPSGAMIGKLPEKMKNLKEKDIEDAQTLEELKKKQKEEQHDNVPEEEQEPQQLPGVQEEHQLTKNQVNNMKGPKTSLNQIVDKKTLGNIIGLEGKYMQIVDADTIRRLLPDIQIPTNQRTIPIEIYPDGTANVIGEDKLQFSTREGTNSTREQKTVTNEGLVQDEQNIETFNITSKGGMHTIAVGYDENGGRPLEVKYGWRDVEESNHITYSELETVHEGPMKQDNNTNQYKRDDSEGIYKSESVLTQEDLEKYARAKGLYLFDEHGCVEGFDIETAKEEILEDGRDIDEIIEDLDVKTIEPETPKSLYE